MQSFSFSTINPPEPIIAPILLSASKSTGTSHSLAGIHPPEGPPICTAFSRDVACPVSTATCCENTRLPDISNNTTVLFANRSLALLGMTIRNSLTAGLGYTCRGRKFSTPTLAVALLSHSANISRNHSIVSNNSSVNPIVPKRE
jgi:hypothetical protein